jgi:hypothetical protein
MIDRCRLVAAVEPENKRLKFACLRQSAVVEDLAVDHHRDALLEGERRDVGLSPLIFQRLGQRLLRRENSAQVPVRVLSYNNIDRGDVR